MVNVVNFFPANAKGQLTHQEHALLNIENVSNALVMDLPLRYIFQYALNHLQEGEKQEDATSPILGSNSKQQQRTVLIVTESRRSLQEWMRQEQKLYETSEPSQGQQIGEQEKTPTATAQDEGAGANLINPWLHLFPPINGSNIQDEFISATQTQSQAQLSQMQLSQGSQQMPLATSVPATNTDVPCMPSKAKEMEIETFQAALWSRIQIRYAPTVQHVRSLFRCLHLDSETTQGRTFGHGREGYSPTVHDDGVPEDILHSMPTLVMLIGCFQGHGSGPAAQTSSSLCVLPSHLANSRPTDESPTLASTAIFTPQSTQQSQLQSQQQQLQIPFQSYQPIPQIGALDRERVQYIKSVSETISEIKDSLEWIERVSGQNVELTIFENTVNPRTLTDPNHRSLRDSSLPSPRELWLQKIVGFWVDAIVVVEHQDSNQPYSQEMLGESETSTEMGVQSSKDSLSLWLKTQQSIRGMLFGATSNLDEKNAASDGAIVGLRWEFDMGKLCFRFQILS
ncbi:hypothetical protein BGX27_010805 [Mortierella sp. AM989]|nr:hypothetical protein BGX27_010805 [Mortierella sp. AM989]